MWTSTLYTSNALTLSIITKIVSLLWRLLPKTSTFCRYCRKKLKKTFSCKLPLALFEPLQLYTEEQVSEFEVILVRNFPRLDWIRTRITPNTDTFQEVLIIKGIRSLQASDIYDFKNELHNKDIFLAMLNWLYSYSRASVLEIAVNKGSN